MFHLCINIVLLQRRSYKKNFNSRLSKRNVIIQTYIHFKFLMKIFPCGEMYMHSLLHLIWEFIIYEKHNTTITTNEIVDKRKTQKATTNLTWKYHNPNLSFSLSHLVCYIVVKFETLMTFPRLKKEVPYKMVQTIFWCISTRPKTSFEKCLYLGNCLKKTRQLLRLCNN